MRSSTEPPSLIIRPRLTIPNEAQREKAIAGLSSELASAINEVAGEEIALAHHGSVAREKRAAIEERLKQPDAAAGFILDAMREPEPDPAAETLFPAIYADLRTNPRFLFFRLIAP